MGNTLTQEEQTLSDSLQQQYIFQSNQFLVHKATQRPCTLHRISTFSKQQSASVERNITHYYQAKCNSISKIKQHFKLDNSGYCSDQQKFYLVFDGHNSPNVKEEYFSRRYSGHGFSYDEIQSILSCMLCGIRHYYQLFNRKESRISLQSVCIDRYNNNNLWLKDPWLVQKQNDSGQLPINFLATYPSPEKIQASNFSNVDFNQYKSDLFSIGIFGLQFLNMNYRDDLYVHKKFVDRQRLGQSLNTINNPRLRGGLGILLSEDPDQRSKIFRYWDIMCSKVYRINSVRGQNLRFSSVNTNNLSNVSSINNPHFGQLANVNLPRSQINIQTISPPKQSNQFFWRLQTPQVPLHQPPINIIQTPAAKQFNRSVEIKKNFIEPQSKRLIVDNNFRKKSQTFYYQEPDRINQSQKRLNSNSARVNFQSSPKDNQLKNRGNQNINIHIPPKKIPPSQQNKIKQTEPLVPQYKNPSNQIYQNQFFQPQNKPPQQNTLKKSYETPKFNYQSPYFNSQSKNTEQNQQNFYRSQKNQPMLNSFNLYQSTQKQSQQGPLPYQPHQNFYYNNSNTSVNPILTTSIINSPESNGTHNANQAKISNQDPTNTNSNNHSLSLRQTKKISESDRNSSSFNYLQPNNPNQTINKIQDPIIPSNQIKIQSNNINHLIYNPPSFQIKEQIKQKKQKVDLSLLNNTSPQADHKNQINNQNLNNPIIKSSPESNFNAQNIPTSPSSGQVVNNSTSPHQVTPPPAIRNPNKYNSTIVQVNQETPNQSSESENQNQGDIQFIVQEYQTGSRYEGFKKNGLRHGRGKFFYQDGGYYDGEWKKNQMHGWGKLFYQGGQLAYEGNWAHDQFHGYGKVYNDNPVTFEGGFDYTNFDLLDDYWEFYQGMLANDTKQGRGRIQLTNKQVFEGDFHTDRIQGFGKFLRRDGTIVQGIWRDSRLMKILNSNDIYK